MRLQYPLNCYDEGGRLKPPLFLYLGLAFMCRGLLILVVALSLPDESDSIMRIFYPGRDEFYFSLAPALLAVMLFILIGQRNSLWASQKQYYFHLLFPLIFIALSIDVAVQLYILSQHQFVFSLNKALSLTFCGAFLVFLVTNSRLRAIHKDWLRNE